jgi:hypothetical protein
MIAVSAGAASAENDPFIGKWLLDREHSHYETGEPLQDMVITIEPAGEGFHYLSETAFKSGEHVKVQYDAQYDGHLAMVSGDNGVLAPVAVTRIDYKTVEAQYKRGFKVVAIARRVVSDDGSSMTITTIAKDPKDGKETTLNVAVFDRIR